MKKIILATAIASIFAAPAFATENVRFSDRSAGETAPVEQVTHVDVIKEQDSVTVFVTSTEWGDNDNVHRLELATTNAVNVVRNNSERRDQELSQTKLDKTTFNESTNQQAIVDAKQDAKVSAVNGKATLNAAHIEIAKEDAIAGDKVLADSIAMTDTLLEVVAVEVDANKAAQAKVNKDLQNSIETTDIIVGVVAEQVDANNTARIAADEVLIEKTTANSIAIKAEVIERKAVDVVHEAKLANHTTRITQAEHDIYNNTLVNQRQDKSIKTLQSDVSFLKNDVSFLKDEVKRLDYGIASMAAMGNLVAPKNAGDTYISVGIATYNDVEALALGVTHNFDDNLAGRLAIGTAPFNSDSKPVVAASMGWSFN